MSRIGVDLGGTKIEVVVLSDEGQQRLRHRVPTPPDDYPAILAAICTLVEEVEEKAKIKVPVIGIGTPGAISPQTGLLKNSNSVILNGQPLDRDLTLALGRQVVMGNDADCFALAEAITGAGRGFRSVFGVILGTGVGGGLVINGELVSGPNRLVGEWGNNPLPWPQPEELPGPECYCGQHGCIERWISGPGFSRAHKQETGQELSSEDIVIAMREGEEHAVGSFGRFIDRLARSLATVINILDPEVIVLGGGMSNITEIYAAVPQVWSEYVFGGECQTPLLPNHHGDSAGVLGAAMLTST